MRGQKRVEDALCPTMTTGAGPPLIPTLVPVAFAHGARERRAKTGAPLRPPYATAVGLIAAIPATIFHDKFTPTSRNRPSACKGFADEIAAILSRRLYGRDRGIAITGPASMIGRAIATALHGLARALPALFLCTAPALGQFSFPFSAPPSAIPPNSPAPNAAPPAALGGRSQACLRLESQPTTIDPRTGLDPATAQPT